MYPIYLSIKRNLLRNIYSKVYRRQKIDKTDTQRYWESIQTYKGRRYKATVKLFKYVLEPGGLLGFKSTRYMFTVEMVDLETYLSLPIVSIPMLTANFLVITTIPFRIALTTALKWDMI